MSDGTANSIEGVGWAVAKGIGKAAAKAIAPRTTNLISQTKQLVKELTPDEDKDKKRAGELFGRDI